MSPCRRGPGLVLGEPRERPRWRDVGFWKRLWGRWSGRVVAPGRRAGLGASGREEGAGGGRAGRCVRARPWGSGLCARRGHLPGPQSRLPGLSGVRGNFSVSVTSEDCRAVGVTGCPCDRLFSLCPVRLAHEREGTARGLKVCKGQLRCSRRSESLQSGCADLSSYSPAESCKVEPGAACYCPGVGSKLY